MAGRVTLRGLLCVMLICCASCDLGAKEPGSFSVNFRWRDTAPVDEAWVHARVEEARDQDTVQIAESPVVPVAEGAALQFSSVPHGGPYKVVVEVRASADKRSRVLYFGESARFYLRPGRHVDIPVALALAATPSVGNEAVRVVDANALGYVRVSEVTLSLAPRDAERVVVANDFALKNGSAEIELSSLSRDRGRYLLPWELDAGRCDVLPCPDGARSVFVQFLNEQGYPSSVESTEVVLDRVGPEVADASLTPSPAGAGAEISLVLNPSEPLAGPPTLFVTPEDPGFSPFEKLAGGGYVARLQAPRTESPNLQFAFAAELEDRAGNRQKISIARQLVVDTTAPKLASSAQVEPAIVRAGEQFVVRLVLDEDVASLPVVRVGTTLISCEFEAESRQQVSCSHAAREKEGGGEFAIVVEARDAASNLAILVAGSVVYDTQPRCGDGEVSNALLEQCDNGPLNSNAPDAACRPDCLPRRCGDAIVDVVHGEACDDGNDDDGDGCASDCSSDETCGNGIVDSVTAEQCDDGNGLTHDGCSSACQEERLVPGIPGHFPRTTVTAATYDTLRGRVLAFAERGALVALGDGGFRRLPSSGAAEPTWAEHLVYDAARDRVVLFDWGRLWEWAEGEWTERWQAGRRGPEERAHVAMTYVSSSGHTLLFGGGLVSGGGAMNDLWAWDGNTWQQQTPDGDKPAPRTGASMTYDPKRDRVLLFGGSTWIENEHVEFSDTWEWDGSAWQQIETEGSVPSPRDDHEMAYDPSRDRIVMWGGGARKDEVWEWDGARWQQRPHAGVSAYEAGLIFDIRNQRMLAISGINTFRLDDAAWTRLDQNCFPAVGHAEVGQAVAYENARGRAVLFGGLFAADDDDEIERYDDQTWSWSDNAWSPGEVTGEAPPARAFATMAHDPLHDVTLLFGGEVGRGSCQGGCLEHEDLGDTWQLEEGRWRRMEGGAEDPPPGRAARMFYDAGQKRITLFAAADDGALGVWLWEGTRWGRAVVAGDRPIARSDFAVAYDVLRNRGVLFGGAIEENGSVRRLSDTWEWDGQRFLAGTPAHSPIDRSGHALVFHATRGRVVLLGGPLSNSTPDVWEWDGNDWHDRSINFRDTEGLVFPPILGHAAFFDNRSQAVVYVGGIRSYGEACTNTLRYEAFPVDQCVSYVPQCPAPFGAEEVCLDGIDGDGDGLEGCLDPDCYSRCAPACVPLSPVCDPMLPRCGDQACSAVEDCAICPTDCGPCPTDCGDMRCEGGETNASCPGDCTG